MCPGASAAGAGSDVCCPAPAGAVFGDVGNVRVTNMATKETILDKNQDTKTINYTLDDPANQGQDAATALHGGGAGKAERRGGELDTSSTTADRPLKPLKRATAMD